MSVRAALAGVSSIGGGASTTTMRVARSHPFADLRRLIAVSPSVCWSHTEFYGGGFDHGGLVSIYLIACSVIHRTDAGAPPTRITSWCVPVLSLSPTVPASPSQLVASISSRGSSSSWLSRPTKATIAARLPADYPTDDYRKFFSILNGLFLTTCSSYMS
jgi:hypothetical protein